MASPKKKNVVNLNDYKAKKAQHGAIDIETDGGTFTVPPPELWPDAVIEKSTTDPVGAARALIGDDYDAFVAAGGSAAVLMSIVADEHGLNAGE